MQQIQGKNFMLESKRKQLEVYEKKQLIKHLSGLQGIPAKILLSWGDLIGILSCINT